MSRYIDAEALYVDWYDSFVADDGTEHDNIPFISKGQIDDAPSIDIVRCKECKYWNGEDHWCDIRDSYGWDYKPDDFCSYGEREGE